MAMNLEAVLRIVAKTVGLEEVTKLERGIAGAEKAAKDASAAFSAVAGSKIWQVAAAGATAFLGGIALATKAAIDFESSMADVRKVVDGLESPEAFRQMQLEILDLSNTMPIAAAGFAEIYAAAGQSGIARAELKGFAELVAQVSVAFDMTAEQAGTSLAQMKVALGLTTPELRDLADGMNYLSNKTGSTAATLVEFMGRAGSVGKIAGLSAHETMAFGAAMIQSGIQAEVAATSFNNMVKALSKGPSMTDRQVDALRRLGYSMADAASEEKRLTDAVQMESDKRIEKYQNETNQLLKEIGRRYRNQQQQMQDAADDESREFDRASRRRADAQIRAINEDKTLSEEAKRERIAAIQDELDREMTARRRADRDRLQAARDRMDDQQELERNAATGRLKAFESSEKKFVEKAKVEAKKTGEAMANASKQGFADRMQKDAIGTITEVLGRINGLAKSQQISVLSDLFGDEARGLAPMIANLGELTRILGLATDATGRASSVSDEYGVRIATAAAQLQLFWNKLRNLAILVGTTVLPYMSQLVGGLMPLLDAVGAFAKAHPGITAAAVAIGSVTAAVVLALPVIAAFITSIATIKTALAGLAIGAKLAGLQTVVIVAVSAMKGALLAFAGWLVSTALPAILAFFSGPVGWTVLAVAAVVAMAIAFREPIMKFLAWLWDEFSKAMAALGKFLYDWYIGSWVNLWNNTLKGPVTGLWDWLLSVARTSFTALIAIGYQLFVKPWVDLWNKVLREPVSKAWEWLKQTWQQIAEFFTKYVTKPVSDAWTWMVTSVQDAWKKVAEFIPKTIQVATDKVKSIMSGVLVFIANGINSAIRSINNLIERFNKVSAATKSPFRISYLNEVTVPKFAQGGIVDRPTLGVVGEGGEREYIVPESKMAAASSRFLAGQRGASVIPSGSGGGASSAPAGPVQITIKTGPVMQDQSGKRWMTIEDGERLARQTAEQVQRQLRTPGGRYAVGVR